VIHNFPDSAIYKIIFCTQKKFYIFPKEKGRVAIDIGSIPIQIETSNTNEKTRKETQGVREEV
jgi:hypothetical protein